jgi:hypothetical protein
MNLLHVESLYEGMLYELRRINDPLISTIIDFNTSLNITTESMTVLQSTVKTNPFDDEHAEIYFFKYIKPKFHSLHIYIIELYHVISMIPISTDEIIRKYYQHELKVINRFFKRYALYYQYYLADDNSKDKEFFLSRNLKFLPPELKLAILPDSFTSSLDYLFAKFKAYEMLRDCLVRKVKQLDKRKDIDRMEKELLLQRRWWSGNKIELVELAYGLYHSKRINGGNAELGEILSWLESSLNTDLGQAYRMFVDISRRKLVSHTKFLDEMKFTLVSHIQNSFGSK